MVTEEALLVHNLSMTSHHILIRVDTFKRPVALSIQCQVEPGVATSDAANQQLHIKQ